MFDVVTLFHLCEFSPARYGRESVVWHDDASILALMLRRLNNDGIMLFYTKSFAWQQARLQVEKAVEEGHLVKREEYQGLLVYGRS